MPTGFYAGQTPPPRDLFSRPNTDMVTYSAQPTPINVAYPSSASTSRTFAAPNTYPTNTTRPTTHIGTSTDAMLTASFTPPSSLPSNTSDATAKIWEGIESKLRDLGLTPTSHRIYQKPYPSIFDSVSYPAGWRVPDFIKFDGEGTRTTWEHISQYMAQLGEASSVEALRVRLFSLSLTGTAFAWFSSLAPSSIYGWEPLERKFHEHFYSGSNEAKLLDLTSVRQGRDESVDAYIRRFRDIKNRCFNLTISEKDLVDLAFNGLRSHLKEKLESHNFLNLSQLQQRASTQESRSKDSKDAFRSNRREIHVVDCDSASSDDESNDVYAAEFVWPSKSKSYDCDALKPVHKNRQEEIKFTFDVAKCDRIFDELYKTGYIKTTHTIPPLDELKRRAYCKWHNSYSHATNDCNVFRRQVQSAINEDRLKFKEMQIDRNPFPTNTFPVDLQSAKVLLRPDQSGSAKGKNVIIGNERPMASNAKAPTREVVLDKSPDGRESIKVTIKGSGLGGQASGDD